MPGEGSKNPRLPLREYREEILAELSRFRHSGRFDISTGAVHYLESLLQGHLSSHPITREWPEDEGPWWYHEVITENYWQAMFHARGDDVDQPGITLKRSENPVAMMHGLKAVAKWIQARLAEGYLLEWHGGGAVSSRGLFTITAKRPS